MLSNRLIELIQDHADQLMERLIYKFKTDPHTPSFRCLSNAEILSRCDTILKNLGAWMEGSLHEKIQHHYKHLGAALHRESIPASELIYALVLTKDHLLDFARTYGLAGSVLDIYAELAFQCQLGHFFDDAIYYAAVGHENAANGPKNLPESDRSFGATPEELARL